MPFDSNGNASITRQRAVTGQTVLAEQVNVPFDDAQSMFSQVLLRSGVAPMVGNLNMNGFKILGAGEATNGSDFITLDQLNAAIAAMQTNTVPMGTRGEFYLTAAPSGWVAANGETIGSASSGATNRANADTKALFTALWAFDNTLLPIQNSAGVATTRGASADADFAANKRMPVFNETGLYTRGSGGNGAGAVGTYQDDSLKSHAHTGTTSSNGEHQHATGAGNYNVTGGGGTFPGFGNQTSVFTTFAGLHTHTFTTDASGGTETRPKTRAVLVCIKL